MRQAYYRDSAASFLATSNNEILGKLNKGATEFATAYTRSTISWDNSIVILKTSLTQLILEQPNARNWHILFEYEIPRLGSRIDIILLAQDVIFVIEFKDEREKFNRSDLRQVEDYALDLSDFHFESRQRLIVPILLAPNAKSETLIIEKHKEINVQPCIKTNQKDLAKFLLQAFKEFSNNGTPINAEQWERSNYSPTPTIIQAACALFSGQKVENITKSGADSENISITTKYIIDRINEAQANSKKMVCFVTGVPGAGKTLVGLNIVHEKAGYRGNDRNTAFFSGNVPLISVLKEALARDHYQQQLKQIEDNPNAKKPIKKDSEREVKAKVQNLHQFIKDGIRKKEAPFEKIGVFDEAQRSWSADHFYNKSKQNENREKDPFDIARKSEAEMLFEFMDRHKDWAVIIALVGGGQEINTGEAGIGEWGKALEEKFNHWEIHISPDLLDGSTSTAGQKLFNKTPDGLKIHPNKNLHLSINQRSFKANNLNEWVNAVLDNEPLKASSIATEIQTSFPILITRDLQIAKDWLKSKKIGTKRIGLVTSSGGLRLRPYGVFANEAIDVAKWFLNDEDDVRSSSFLEMAGKEFVVQGLELDWIGLCWDADFRRVDNYWDYKNFSGTKWQNVASPNDQQFILNTYRVLLTRAREGLIIWIPDGSHDDGTRLPSFYDPIYEYLVNCGAEQVLK